MRLLLYISAIALFASCQNPHSRASVEENTLVLSSALHFNEDGMRYFKTHSTGAFDFTVFSEHENTASAQILFSYDGMQMLDYRMDILPTILDTLLLDLNHNSIPELVVISEDENGQHISVFEPQNTHFNSVAMAVNKAEYTDAKFSIEADTLVLSYTHEAKTIKHVFELSNAMTLAQRS